MVTILTRLLVLFVLFLLVPSPFVVSQTVDPSPLPSDPVALMLLAHEKNGLISQDVRPWHIRGTYTFFGFDGKANENGTYEEWWVSAHKYKRSYNGTKLKQVEYANDTGLYREGLQEWLSGDQLRLRSSLIEPLPDNDALKEFKPQLQVTSVGKNKLNCVRLFYPLRANLTVSNDFFQTDCFDSMIPVLLISSQDGLQTIYSQLVVFQGHYLAKELHFSLRGKPRFELKLDVVENLKEPPDEILKPPANAFAVDVTTAPLKLDKAESRLVRLKLAVPVYPETANAHQFQGAVVMQVTIGKDGHVHSPHVVSGPFPLQQAALDAVQQWLYRPFQVMDSPIEIQTEITIHFSMP